MARVPRKPFSLVPPTNPISTPLHFLKLSRGIITIQHRLGISRKPISTQRSKAFLCTSKRQEILLVTQIGKPISSFRTTQPSSPTPEKQVMSTHGILVSLFLALSFAFASAIPPNRAALLHANESAAEEEMMPLVEQGKFEMVELNETRRRLGSFQICALCTCCGGARGVCLPSPCCYAINCNIPNRPFGFCSFTPKTCNCFGCHL